MIVKGVFNIKGRGIVIVAIITDNEIVHIGDCVICNDLKWSIDGIEMMSPKPKDGHVGLVLRGVKHTESPKNGDVLTVIPKEN